MALRIPFMQIRRRGFERQWAIKGNVVNVETNLTSSVSVLPGNLNEAAVVQVRFKRRLAYKHAYITDKIRPKRVLGALNYLLTTPLYQEHNVSLNDNWNIWGEAEEVEFVADTNEGT